MLKVYDEDNNYHYALVRNKSRLLNCQSNKDDSKKHYCHHCLNPFSTEKAYKNHLEKGCMASEGQQTKMPDKDTYIEFEKHNTKLPCPFVIYGDFECLTTSSNTGMKGTYQEHKPCGYMLNVVSKIVKLKNFMNCGFLHFFTHPQRTPDVSSKTSRCDVKVGDV